jgi:HEAT repeat protein
MNTNTALKKLGSKSSTSVEREEAARHLKYNASVAHLDAYIHALSDSEFNVRWSAADAIASLGIAALPALLDAMLAPDLVEDTNALAAIQRALRLMPDVPAALMLPLSNAISAHTTHAELRAAVVRAQTLLSVDA